MNFLDSILGLGNPSAFAKTSAGEPALANSPADLPAEPAQAYGSAQPAPAMSWLSGIIGQPPPQQQQQPQAPQWRSALGAGLRGVADSWSKPGLAAFAGGAGAALEGGDRADALALAAKEREIDRALKAWQLGNMAAHNAAMARIAQMNAETSRLMVRPNNPPVRPGAPATSSGNSAPTPAPAPVAPDGTGNRSALPPGSSTVTPATALMAQWEPSATTMPAGSALRVADIPAMAPPGVPSGSAYSPSRRQWRAPDLRLFDASGNSLSA